MGPAPTRVISNLAGRFVIADGTLEALKWLGLLLMTLDHFNKYVLHGSIPALFSTGRLAMPLFAFVLSYNLARASTLAYAGVVYPRLIKRLAAVALLASPPYMALGGLAGGWWPLNILATFAVAVAVIHALWRGKRWSTMAALTLAVAGGAFVEYWWPGIAMCVAAWYYCRQPSRWALAAWAAATLALTLDGWAFGAMPVANDSLFALLAIPLIFGASRLDLRLPRSQVFFYAYYPLHLTALWALAR